MEYPTEVKMKLQWRTQAEDSSTRLNIQKSMFLSLITAMLW